MNLEQRVVAAVDAAAVINDLGALLAIPSVDGTAEEHSVQRWCARRLADLGLEVDHWQDEVATLQKEPDFPGMEVARDHVLGCVGRLTGADDGDPALVLCGHTDVVPAGDPERWPGGTPFEPRVVGATMWGRGSCDMKGGVAAILGAVQALRSAGVRLRRPLAVHAVAGEEDGGIGAFATLRRGHRGAACVIAEPTGGAVVSANGGSLTFRLEVSGRATHAATRTSGVSAVDCFEHLHAALRRLEAVRNEDVDPLLAHLDIAYPLSVGSVRTGDWASTVPARLVAEGRYGVRLGEPVDEARQALEAAVSAACSADPWLAAHPATVTWPGGVFASGRLPAGHPLDHDVQQAVAAVAGESPRIHGGPYGSDLRHYAAAGVPTVQYGPGEARFAHAVDEHVALPDVVRSAQVFALLALRQCG